ncbi:unnamed protein product [Paramecium primaurelia]|uniref:Protein kinase domain-containing protein n=1 Tax=Paramecium primaurelia TaxID=5886 RepID=A0A8S1QEB0_PARPR|nr:unnamed protein product [Paramecium primaurelia]
MKEIQQEIMINQDEMEKEFSLLDLNDIEETQFDKFVYNQSFIETHFENLKFQNYDITQNRESQQWQITITLEQYSSKFLAICTTTINFLRKRLDCKSYIAKSDGQFIQVKEKYIQRLLAKYFCKINNSLRFACFSIENETGQIQLKLNSILIEEYWTDLMQLDPMLINESNHPLLKLLNMLHQTSHYAIGYHIYRLMHLINKLSYKVFPFLEQKLQDQYRKIHPQFDIYLLRIEEIIEDKCTIEISEDEIKQFQQHFIYPKQMNPQYKIINKIRLLNSEQIDKSEIISEGEFSILKKGQLDFTFEYTLDQQTTMSISNMNTDKSEIQVKQMDMMMNQDQIQLQSTIKRTIVTKQNKQIKQDINVQQNEIQKKKQSRNFVYEKKILQILSQPLIDKNQKLVQNGYCPYIAQYYMTNQRDEYDQFLFMEFYQNMSLDNFTQKFQATQSLNTRLFILFQIANALRYLSQYGVIHNNLIPKNISKNYFVKLKDFGQAMYKQGDQIYMCENYGGTLPYVAPEVVSIDNQKNNQNKIGHKSDIFSFGMLMYEYLFEQYPIVIIYDVT